MTRPATLALEPRCLLSGATASWLGQDGHDLVGYSPNPGGNGVQDIHIALANLPAGRTITSADVEGLGGGQWVSAGGPNSWLADVVRPPGASTADLYIEPYQADQGRPYNVHLNYDDGTSDSVWVGGGPVDPNLRMSQAAAQLSWIGQDGHDLVGNGPDVGPDNIEDAHLALSGLAAGAPIVSATLTGPGGLAWAVGLNPRGFSDAELVRTSDNSTTADLYINPPINLAGKTLTLTLQYASNKIDTAAVVAGATDPALRMPAPAPFAIGLGTISAAWSGQDGKAPAGTGDVHVAVSGLPAGRRIVAADVSDQSGLAWDFDASDSATFTADPNAGPLIVTRPADPTRADFYFPPGRDEAGATLTVRLLLDDGTTVAARFAGGASDPGLISPGIAPTSVVAHPGDNLNALANAYGTVHLAAGTYALSAPLILNNAVTLDADPGVTLVFSQGANDPAWTAAIKIHAGHTTLEGFSVRFATSIRWASNINYGPAVIATTDNLDPAGHDDPRAAIVIKGLNLESPPASTAWEEAPRLLRLVTASSGEIEGNVLKGGTAEVLGGPWRIINNDYQGTVPNTYTFAAFGTHQTHDLILSGNVAHDVGASGKAWRFLVMSGSGAGDLVANNEVQDLGPRDTDTVPSANAPETILTESYRLHFEGKPSAISANGLILQIPAPQGDPARTGDVVAILSGPEAGQFRTISQAIDARTYLMDAPLPSGDYAISIATGFVGETFRGNTVDDRGSAVADPLVLAGDHYGTIVVGNTLMGGARALTLAATPTEQPVFYGWSHDPMLGLVVADNVLVDATEGAVLQVGHDAAIKTDRGRVYLSATLANNVLRWTSAFLGKQAQGAPAGFTLGEAGSIDAGEMVISESGDLMDVPGGTVPGASIKVVAATVNGQSLTDQDLSLPVGPPPTPPGLVLLNPAVGRVRFSAEAGAIGFEYRVGTAGAYLPASPGVPFVPNGLVAGANSLSVRAFDAEGRRGPDSSLGITLSPPAPVPSPTPIPAAPGVGQVPTPAIQPPSAALPPSTDAPPPTFQVAEAASPSGVWLGQDGHDLTGRWSILAADGKQDVHIALSDLPAGKSIISGDLKGAGGNEWRLNGAHGVYAFALVRVPGSTSADLYFSPYHAETGRAFTLTLRHGDGTSSVVTIRGGTSILGLPMPTAATVRAASARAHAKGATPHPHPHPKPVHHPRVMPAAHRHR